MKSKIIKNEMPARTAIMAGNNENNYLAQLSEKKEYKTKSQTDMSRLSTNYFINHAENPFENYFIKNLVENLFEYVSEQSKEPKLFGKAETFPMLGERETISAFDQQLDLERITSNNILSLNKNGELIKKNSLPSFREENNIFTTANVNNTNNSNTPNISNIIAKIAQGNGTSIFKIENDSRNSNLNNNNNNSFFTNATKNNPFNSPAGNTSSKNISANFSSKALALNDLENFKQKGNSGIINNNIISSANNSKEMNFCMSENNQNVSLMNHHSNSCSNLNLFKNLSNSNYALNQAPLQEIKKDFNYLSLGEDEKCLTTRVHKSPNPFEDYNFGQNSNIFNSPNPIEGMMYKMPHEGNDKLNINFDLSRNSSIDYNEIFKTGTPDHLEEKKLPKENNLFFDDSFFSISSNDKKSELNTHIKLDHTI